MWKDPLAWPEQSDTQRQLTLSAVLELLCLATTHKGPSSETCGSATVLCAGRTSNHRCDLARRLPSLMWPSSHSSAPCSQPLVDAAARAGVDHGRPPDPLPVDVWLLIFQFLRPTDLSSLRPVCRHWRYRVLRRLDATPYPLRLLRRPLLLPPDVVLSSLGGFTPDDLLVALQQRVGGGFSLALYGKDFVLVKELHLDLGGVDWAVAQAAASCDSQGVLLLLGMQSGSGELLPGLSFSSVPLRAPGLTRYPVWASRSQAPLVRADAATVTLSSRATLILESGRAALLRKSETRPTPITTGSCSVLAATISPGGVLWAVGQYRGSSDLSLIRGIGDSAVTSPLPPALRPRSNDSCSLAVCRGLLYLFTGHDLWILGQDGRAIATVSCATESSQFRKVHVRRGDGVIALEAKDGFGHVLLV